MNIVLSYPPNIDDIDAAFKTRGRQIIYCWGDIIYNPLCIKVHPWLIQHESVHRGQQGDNPKKWWDQYLADPEFRLNQEIEAHRAEYYSLLSINGDNRANRRKFLVATASRLANPVYRYGISTAQAKEFLE